MEHFKTYTLSLIFTEADASGNVAVSVNLTGSPDSPPLTGLFIIPVKDILHGETGAGRTDKVAPSATDTSAAVFFPDFMGRNIFRKSFRDRDSFFIFFYILDVLSVLGNSYTFCIGRKNFIFQFQVKTFFGRMGIAVIVFSLIGSHGDAEAGFKRLTAAH